MNFYKKALFLIQLVSNHFFKFGKRRVRLLIISIIYFLTIFSFSFAEVSFSEVNYDPEGADTGYEWVEVFNNNSSEIDFSQYKFCEGGACHGLTETNENKKIIPKNSYAIITSDPDKFLQKNQSFSEDNGFIFKSSFSLKNSDGEKLELQNKDKNVVSVLVYNPSIGGKDGDTLSVIDGVLVNSFDTAGKENLFKENKTDTDTDSDESQSDETTDSQSNSDSLPIIQRTYVELQDEDSDLLDGKKKVKVVVDKMNILIAGGSHKFSSKVMELSGADISKPEQVKYFWNFGDGQTSDKKYPVHTYKSSGEYIISLKVLINSWAGQTKVLVKVIDSPIFIENIDYSQKKIILKNSSGFIINISGFKIVSQNNFFEIPENTFINKNSEVSFAQEVSGLVFDKNYPIALTYDNNKTIHIFTKDFQKKLKEDLKIKIKKTENEISLKESQLEDIEKNKNIKIEKSVIKSSLVWNVSEKEIREIEKMKWQAEREKVVLELEVLRAKRQKNKLSLEKAIRQARESKIKSQNKETKKILKGGSVVEKEINNENKNYQEEEVLDIQKNEEKDFNLKNKDHNSANKIKNFFVKNIFEFILTAFILFVSLTVYIYKKINNKNIPKIKDGMKKEKEEGSVDDWEIEELK